MNALDDICASSAPGRSRGVGTRGAGREARASRQPAKTRANTRQLDPRRLADLQPKFTASQRRQMARTRPLRKGERRCASSKAKVRKPICWELECQDGPCRRLKERGLKDDRTPLPKAERPVWQPAHEKGAPCKARGVPGKTKCRVHVGCSNGPKTPEGKAKTAAAMREGVFKHRDRIMAQWSAAKAEWDAAKKARNKAAD